MAVAPEINLAQCLVVGCSSSKPPTIVLVPCGHLCCCEDCATTVEYCPLPPCGQKIERAISSDVAASEPVASLTNSKCLVCTEKTPTIALQPCGHMCVCKECRSIEICPIPSCQKKVEGSFSIED